MGWLTKAVSKVGDGLSSAAQNLRSGFVPQVLQFGELQVMTTALLAEGGYSYVYSAREVGASAKPFAVKKMITQDAEGAEVAELEVRVLEQLQTHAGIVGFHGWMKKEQGGKRCEYWMLLEYCPNGSLIDVLYRKGRGGEFERQPRLEQPRLLEIFEQVVAGVVHMHAQRPPVAHRDLKLENVLCSHSGAYVLCDFGSCSTAVLPAERTRKQVVEQEEAISKYSTLMYRAPEMVDLYLKHELGPKVDVWALGCILYALCYYDHPFASESTLQILNAGFAIPHDSALHFSPQIPALIKAMLTSDPARRPDAAEVLLVLGKLRKLPPPAPPPKAPAPPPAAADTPAFAADFGAAFAKEDAAFADFGSASFAPAPPAAAAAPPPRSRLQLRPSATARASSSASPSPRPPPPRRRRRNATPPTPSATLPTPRRSVCRRRRATATTARRATPSAPSRAAATPRAATATASAPSRAAPARTPTASPLAPPRRRRRARSPPPRRSPRRNARRRRAAAAPRRRD